MAEKLNSKINYLRRNRLKLAFGALALGTVVSIPSIDNHVDEILENTPEIASGVFVSESLFVGGLALMLASQSRKVLTKDVLSKSYLKEELYGKSLDNNALLKTGLALNTVGALGTSMIIGYGALETLPTPMLPSALTIAGLDIAATVAIRYNIFKGISESIETANIEEIAEY